MNQEKETELGLLRYWFNTYYTEHEHKFRRLYSLNIKCDDGTDPYEQLMSLYKEAENKRKKIQEIEQLLSIN